MAPKLAKHLGYFCRKFITKTFKKNNLVTQYAATFFGILLVLYISGDLDDKMISNLAAVDMVVGFNKSETKGVVTSLEPGDSTTDKKVCRYVGMYIFQQVRGYIPISRYLFISH